MNIKDTLLTAIKKIKIFIKNLVRKISEKIKEIVGKLKSEKIKIKLSSDIQSDYAENKKMYKDSKDLDNVKTLELQRKLIEEGNESIKKEMDRSVIRYFELTNFKEYYNKLVGDLKMINGEIYSLEKSLVKEENNELISKKLALAKAFLTSVNLAFVAVKISKRASKNEIEEENKRKKDNE